MRKSDELRKTLTRPWALGSGCLVLGAGELCGRNVLGIIQPDLASVNVSWPSARSAGWAAWAATRNKQTEQPTREYGK